MDLLVNSNQSLMDNTLCTDCGRSVPSHEGIHRSDGKGGSFGFVCGRCWSAILSKAVGEDVGHLEIAPVVMRDAAGLEHEFHFRFNPAPRGVEAFELVDGRAGGYMFQVLQEDDDPRILEQLLGRMRRGLACEHLVSSDITPGGSRVKDLLVRGRFDWDEDQDGHLPCVVVDGRQFSWDQFGAMLMTFEGCQFRLEIIDRSEEA